MIDRLFGLGSALLASHAFAQEQVVVEPYLIPDSERAGVFAILEPSLSGPYRDAASTQMSTVEARKIGQMVHVCGFVRGKGLLAEVPFYVIKREDYAVGLLAGLGNDFFDAWFVRQECELLGMELPPSSANPGPPRAWEGEEPPELLPERTSSSTVIIFPETGAITDASGAAVEAAPAQLSRWVIAEDISPLDDSKTVVLSLQSSDMIPDRYGNGAGPGTIIVRCQENTTSVYFIVNGAFLSDLQGYGSVRYRIDDRSANAAEFEVSTDNEALGLWNGRRAIPFISDLFESDELYVRITPYNESAVDMNFPTSGLADDVVPLREACGW